MDDPGEFALVILLWYAWVNSVYDGANKTIAVLKPGKNMRTFMTGRFFNFQATSGKVSGSLMLR